MSNVGVIDCDEGKEVVGKKNIETNERVKNAIDVFAELEATICIILDNKAKVTVETIICFRMSVHSIIEF